MTRTFLKPAFAIYLLTTLVAAGALLGPSSAWAASSVNVEMWDDGPSVMGLKLDKDTVPAGKVTFKGTNTSTNNIEHEMLVIKVDSKLPKLPYDEDTARVPENKINSLGEIEEIEAGEKGQLTINMKPGIYMLFCNRPGHFVANMKTLFFVK